MAEEFHDVLPVSQLPNRAVIGMRLSLPDGRIFEGRDQDGTGCGAWVYIADIVTSMQYRVMEIDREWPPKWLCENGGVIYDIGTQPQLRRPTVKEIEDILRDPKTREKSDVDEDEQ